MNFRWMYSIDWIYSIHQVCVSLQQRKKGKSEPTSEPAVIFGVLFICCGIPGIGKVWYWAQREGIGEEREEKEKAHEEEEARREKGLQENHGTPPHP